MLCTAPIGVIRYRYQSEVIMSRFDKLVLWAVRVLLDEKGLWTPREKEAARAVLDAIVGVWEE